MSKKRLPSKWNPRQDILGYAIHPDEAAKDISEARNALRRLERSRESARAFLDQLCNTKMPPNVRLSARVQDEDLVRSSSKTLAYREMDSQWVYYGSIVIIGETHRFFANQAIQLEGVIALVDTNSGWGITPSPSYTLEMSPYGDGDDKEGANAVKIHAETLRYLEEIDPTQDCTYFSREWIHREVGE